MRLFYRTLGAEIVVIHVGHALFGVFGLWLIASNVPWWSVVAGLPLIAFLLLFWLYEARFVLPVARRYLSGEPFPALATTTTRPRGPRGA